MRKTDITRILAGIVSLILAGCASASLSLDHDEFAEVRTEIQQAQSVDAEKCAPDLLAKSVSRLYWAAHELSEDQAGDITEVAELIAQAGDYARQAKHFAVKNCKGSTTVILLPDDDGNRSEEHTSELQSHHDLVCRLLLEKKNNGCK